MNKKGFATMYTIYSLFIVIILVMLTNIFINTYKVNFLNTLKSDIKMELENYSLENKSVLNE